MKRAYRLRKPEQFQRVRREGQTCDVPMLALNSAPNRRRTTRCGFVVGKRIGKAVDRNRVRRRVREAVRLAYQSIAPGYDLVFVARSPGLATVDFDRLQALVEQLLRRAGVWHDAAMHHELPQ